MKMYNDVLTFIKACDQEQNGDNAKLYDKLIKEEFNEYQYADNPTVEFDACMDMIWVILGYCKMKGFDVYGAWNEVARSNLAKIDIQTGKVVKNEAGKVMKPEGWQPPQLDKFLKIE